MKTKTSVIIAIVLGVLLVVALGYIGYGIWQQARYSEQSEIYLAGQEAGYELAIIQIMQQAATCNTVPLTYNETTLTMFAAECLEQPNEIQ